MSLQVWLPFTGHSNNQGAAVYNPSISGLGYTSGKIGQSLNAGSYVIPASTCNSMLSSGSISIAMWIKPISGSGNFFGQGNMNPGDNRMYTLFQYPTANDLHWSWQAETSSGTFTSGVITGAFPSDTWTHLCVTYDGYNGKIYFNGVLHTSFTASNQRTNFNYNLPIYSNGIRQLNDVRIYDHALSLKEVKELSKSMLMHIKLNDDYMESTTNVDKFKGTYPYDLQGQQLAERVTFQGKDCWHVICSLSSTGWFGCYSVWSGHAAGTYLTRSCDLYIPSGQNTSNWYSDPYALENGTIIARKNYDYSKPDTWQHCYMSGYATSTSSNFLYYMLAGSNSSGRIEFYIANVQAEYKDHYTPYTPDSRAGSTSDCSGNGHNVTTSGTITLSTDTPIYDKSAVFNGGDNAIYLGDFSTICPTSIYTFSIWFKKKTDEWSSDPYETIWGGPGGFEIEAKPAGTNSAYIRPYSWGGNDGSKDFAYPLDQWNHLVMVSNGSDTKFYLNGVEKVTGTFITFPSGNYYLGSWRDAASQNFRGQLVDARWYATAFSAADVMALYNERFSIDNKNNLYVSEIIET